MLSQGSMRRGKPDVQSLQAALCEWCYKQTAASHAKRGSLHHLNEGRHIQTDMQSARMAPPDLAAAAAAAEAPPPATKAAPTTTAAAAACAAGELDPPALVPCRFKTEPAAGVGGGENAGGTRGRRCSLGVLAGFRGPGRLGAWRKTAEPCGRQSCDATSRRVAAFRRREAMSFGQAKTGATDEERSDDAWRHFVGGRPNGCWRLERWSPFGVRPQ
jgi:hypothetical protein